MHVMNIFQLWFSVSSIVRLKLGRCISKRAFSNVYGNLSEEIASKIKSVWAIIKFLNCDERGHRQQDHKGGAVGPTSPNHRHHNVQHPIRLVDLFLRSRLRVEGNKRYSCEIDALAQRSFPQTFTVDTMTIKHRPLVLNVSLFALVLFGTKSVIIGIHALVVPLNDLQKLEQEAFAASSPGSPVEVLNYGNTF